MTTDRDKWIASIVYRLPVLSDEELCRTANRIECLTATLAAPRYGSAVAQEQVARGELPTGLDVAPDRVELWDSRGRPFTEGDL